MTIRLPRMKRDLALKKKERILGMETHTRVLVEEYKEGNQNGLVQNIPNVKAAKG